MVNENLIPKTEMVYELKIKRRSSYLWGVYENLQSGWVS